MSGGELRCFSKACTETVSTKGAQGRSFSEGVKKRMGFWHGRSPSVLSAKDFLWQRGFCPDLSGGSSLGSHSPFLLGSSARSLPQRFSSARSEVLFPFLQNHPFLRIFWLFGHFLLQKSLFSRKYPIFFAASVRKTTFFFLEPSLQSPSCLSKKGRAKLKVGWKRGRTYVTHIRKKFEAWRCDDRRLEFGWLFGH